MRITHYATAATLALILSASVGLPSAQATLVDNNNFTTDTATGLDWLDVTQTENMSYNTVVADFATSLSGWHYATLAQVGTLFTDAGALGPYDFSGASPNGGPINGAAAQLIANLLGSTGALGANSAKGLITDSDGAGGHYVSTYWAASGFSYLLDCDCFGSQSDSASSTTVGSFLVRNTGTTGHADAVPEPASMALLGGGLAGLGFVRRRKTA